MVISNFALNHTAQVDDLKPIASVDAFVTATYGTGKLIYVEKDSSEHQKLLMQVPELEEQGFQVICDGFTCKQFAATTSSMIFIFTDLTYLRGFDFRRDTSDERTRGLSLLIMTAMPGFRSLIQAVGRVGRLCDESERHIIEGVAKYTPEVDVQLDAQLKQLMGPQ